MNSVPESAFRQGFRISGVALFFLLIASELILYVPAVLAEDQSVLVYAALATLIVANLALLYAAVTRHPDFGKLAVGFCGFMWVLGTCILFYDAGADILPPAGVKFVFWTNVQWVFWSFFFHGMFL